MKNHKILKLNKIYMPLLIQDWQDAMINIFSGAATPVRVTLDEDGSIEQFYACSLEEWKELEPVEGDELIGVPNGNFIVPKIVICSSFDKIPIHKPKFPTKKAIWLRDNNTCLYTGRLLKKSELSIDHILPKSRGGKDTWENLATCCKLLNSKKGDKTPEEFGIKLIKKPTKPSGKQVFECIHPEWDSFLKSMS